MMKNDHFNKFRPILESAYNEAKKLNSPVIRREHFLLSLLRDKSGQAYRILSQLNVPIDKIIQQVEDHIVRNNEDGESTTLFEQQYKISLPAIRLLQLATSEARKMRNSSVIGGEHILLALLHDNRVEKDDFIRQIKDEYFNFDISIQGPYAGMDPSSMSASEDDYEDELDSDLPPSSRSTSRSSGKNSGSDTPALDKYGYDMTKAAANGTLDPVIGREREIERLAQVLSRRKKNNPVLIGEPGVGKSAIVEGLAIRIVNKKVPRLLFNKRLVGLDMAGMVAGTKYRGQFEERIKAVLDELSKNPDIILFIDEIHTIVGAGNAPGSMDAANLLKPALARGEIQCIGATTLDEYRQNIEKDGALERRFQKVMVEPTTPEETLEILRNVKDKYEDHHNVIYTDQALKACVDLTERYVSDRNFPDKALDALDEAGSRVHISQVVVPEEIENLEAQIEKTTEEKLQAVQNQQFELAANLRDKETKQKEELEKVKLNWEKELDSKRETVDDEKVAEVVALMTGVPTQRVAQAEGARLLKMGDTLQGSVIGQDDAITKVVKAIQRNRVGLKNPDKPIGVFMFLGPTGVGKTLLAKKLAEYLFDSPDALIRMDMSEFMEKFTVSRLVGAPPGYVGYEEGGQLTEKVRRRPYSVVLLDEIEKAHPDVFNILLQLMDEGRITDSLGRRIDFKNTIVIMTSNVGSRQLKDFGTGIGFNTNSVSDKKQGQEVISKALNRAFSPEFLNRIDDIIMFDSLSQDDIQKIINIELRDFMPRIEKLGYSLNITPEAKKFVADKGYDQNFGARPLKRSIQKYLEDDLAEMLLSLNADDKIGGTINVGYMDGADKLTFAYQPLILDESSDISSESDSKSDSEQQPESKPGKENDKEE